MASTDQILKLVEEALSEIDDRPPEVTGRRTARIASLLGETRLALRLGFELKPHHGRPASNAEESRRLMADPSDWDNRTGEAEEAMLDYTATRGIPDDPDGKLMGHSLAELDALEEAFDDIPRDDRDSSWVPIRAHIRTVKEGLRHTMFAALCSWERRLSYSDTNERIFGRFQTAVDAELAAGAPEILDAFNAVYRRFRDVATSPDAPVGEELSQAVTSCRRILKAVADRVSPVRASFTVTDDGHALTDDAYRNRVFQYLSERIQSDSFREAAQASVAGLFERFEAIDRLANKGVHASLGLREAELCAINTYIVAGELLRLAVPGSEEVPADT